MEWAKFDAVFLTKLRPGRLWTSSLRRTIETAQFIEHPILTGVKGGSGLVFHQVSFSSADSDEVFCIILLCLLFARNILRCMIMVYLA